MHYRKPILTLPFLINLGFTVVYFFLLKPFHELATNEESNASGGFFCILHRLLMYRGYTLFSLAYPEIVDPTGEVATKIYTFLIVTCVLVITIRLGHGFQAWGEKQCKKRANRRKRE